MYDEIDLKESGKEEFESKKEEIQLIKEDVEANDNKTNNEIKIE